MRYTMLIAAMLLFCSILSAQEEGGSSGDRIGLVNLAANFLNYTYTNIEDVPDNGVDDVNFGPDLTAALITGGFALVSDLYILARFGFNVNWQDGDWQSSTFQFGPGIRFDFMNDPIVAYGGVFLSYALQEVGTGGGGEAHLHFLIPELFVGGELPVSDHFSIGGQVALSYLHCWAQNENITPVGTVTTENEINGVTLALLLSATVYF